MTKPASAPPADKWIALEANLKARYDVCEDFAATPSSILLAVLNAVAAVNDDTTAQLADIAASAQVREVEANCRGSWQLGNNCKRCPRCLSTMPAAEPVPVAQGDAPPFAIVGGVEFAGSQDLCIAHRQLQDRDAERVSLTNMLILCGEREVRDVVGLPEKLRALIDGLIHQRRRAEATEASLAACRALLGICAAAIDAACPTQGPETRALRKRIDAARSQP